MNPDGQMDLRHAIELTALCEEMCPEYERVRRIVQNDLKAPEYTADSAHGPRKDRVPDETRMVKAHTRSAAGAESEFPTDVRTPATCLVHPTPMAMSLSLFL